MKSEVLRTYVWQVTIWRNILACAKQLYYKDQETRGKDERKAGKCMYQNGRMSPLEGGVISPSTCGGTMG